VIYLDAANPIQPYGTILCATLAKIASTPLYGPVWWEVKQEQEQAAAERAAREEKEREAEAL
jgi:hypothetical protein